MDWGDAQIFQAPPGWREYLAGVQARVRRLIDLGIWGGIDSTQLNQWLKNFETPEERYFATCVLDALTYRNAGQTKSLMRDLFDRRLPQELNPNEMPYLNWLRDPKPPTNNQHAVMVPVISDNQSPAKSGPLLARMYRRDLRINQNKMLWPWQIKDLRRPPKLVIFVDDFLGSGSQFKRFAKRFEIDQQIGSNTTRWIYAPLVAHTTGIDSLKSQIPGLSVVFAEKLDHRCDLFSEKHSVFADGFNSRDAVIRFYDKLVADRLNRIKPRDRRGYRRMGLAFAFAHATPNNSLPVLRQTSPKWTPLLQP